MFGLQLLEKIILSDKTLTIYPASTVIMVMVVMIMTRMLERMVMMVEPLLVHTIPLLSSDCPQSLSSAQLYIHAQ